MKKFIPLTIITALAGLIILALMPGCDELITKENYYYDTLRIDGTNYEADTTCGLCHNDKTDSITIASRQWAFSGHSTGNLTDYDYLGENTAECGPECHTNEGYVQYLADSTNEAIYFPTEIGCFACHSPHENRDFSLRDQSDLCIQCHQQSIDPPLSGLPNISISNNWGPHFSTEYGMLLGNGGYEFDFFTYNSSSHATMGAGGCQTCHMDMANGFTLGGHSLNIAYNSEQLTVACNVSGCHIGDPVEDFINYNPLQSDLTDSLAILKDSLVAAGLLTISDVPVAQTLSGDSLVSDSAGALFNYLFVSGDSSSGIHNLLYAHDLVNSSLNFLSDRFTLTVTNASTDSGTVTLDPAGGIYIRGTTVEVTADPNAGYTFDSWGGDLFGTDNPASILMDSDKTITVNYTAMK